VVVLQPRQQRLAQHHPDLRGAESVPNGRLRWLPDPHNSNEQRASDP
jgi:hypothetical protein